MDDVVWAELDALSNIRPFTKDNTIEHIKSNPAVWNQLFDHKHVAYADLPNRQMIDIKGFVEPESIPGTVRSRKSKKLASIMNGQPSKASSPSRSPPLQNEVRPDMDGHETKMSAKTQQ